MATATRKRGRRKTTKAPPKPVAYRCSEPGCDAKDAKIKAPIVNHQNRTGHVGILAVMKNGKTREVGANESGRAARKTTRKRSSNGAKPESSVDELATQVALRLDELKTQVTTLGEAVEERDEVIRQYDTLVERKDEAFDQLVDSVESALQDLGVFGSKNTVVSQARESHAVAPPERPAPVG